MKFFKFAIAIIGILTPLLSTKSTKIPQVTQETTMTPLTEEFLSGFETGIKLRKSPDKVEEYNCPPAAFKISEFRKIKNIWPSVVHNIYYKNDKGEDQLPKNLMLSLDLLIRNLVDLVSIFENDYQYHAGDYCAGLKFGFSGTNLLFFIAYDILNH